MIVRPAIEGSVRPLPPFLEPLESPLAAPVVAQLVLRSPPSSPSLEATALQVMREHKPLSYQEYLARYSIDASDLNVVRDFAQRYRLRVTEINPASRTVTLSGDGGEMEQAFGVQLKWYNYEKRVCCAPDGPITVPQALSGIVQCVFGLDTLPLSLGLRQLHGFAPLMEREVHLEKSSLARAQAQPWTSYRPDEFARLYDFPAEYEGRNVCLGVLVLYGSYKPEDLKLIFQTTNRPLPVLSTMGNPIWTEGIDRWANFEVALDLQVALACAPAAKHVVYFSEAHGDSDTTAQTYYNVLSSAIFDQVNQPDVLTMSAGLPESLPGIWTPAAVKAINLLLASAASLGITVCFPSGDSGVGFPLGFGMFSAPALVYFPGSSPYVLCCGGTTLSIQNNQIQDEVVWNRLTQNMLLGYGGQQDLCNLGSSSGGVSLYFARPSWQSLANVPEKTLSTFIDWSFTHHKSYPGRGCPDVAANADFFVGYDIMVEKMHRNGGGTSAATPLIAALVARLCEGVGHRLSGLVPDLYDLQLQQGLGVFRTITRGNNGGYSASDALWNPCTGLGSPRGGPLLAALRARYGVP